MTRCWVSGSFCSRATSDTYERKRAPLNAQRERERESESPKEKREREREGVLHPKMLLRPLIGRSHGHLGGLTRSGFAGF